MKAVTWQGKRDVRVEEVPDPIVYSFFTLLGGVVRPHADLYVMNADDTNTRPLVCGSAAKYSPDWQPTH